MKVFDTGRFLMIFFFLLALWSMFDPEMRMALGALVGVFLEPLIGFGGHYPVITLFLASIIMAVFSTAVTMWHTDLVEQARVQKIMSAFNKELREARMKKQTTKVDKLMKMQPELMKMQSSTMGSSFKIMAYTFVIFIAVFAWLGMFVNSLPYRIISVPWAFEVDLNSVHVMNSWFLLYSLGSIPFGIVIRALGKIVVLRRKLSELDLEGLGEDL